MSKKQDKTKTTAAEFGTSIAATSSQNPNTEQFAVRAPDAYGPFLNQNPIVVTLKKGEDIEWEWHCSEDGRTWKVAGYKVVPLATEPERKCVKCFDTGQRAVRHPILGIIDKVWCEYCDHPVPERMGKIVKQP